MPGDADDVGVVANAIFIIIVAGAASELASMGIVDINDFDTNYNDVEMGLNLRRDCSPDVRGEAEKLVSDADEITDSAFVALPTAP